MIAEIPSCERKVRERFRDSQNFHHVKERFMKGSVIAKKYFNLRSLEKVTTHEYTSS
jgi:hypothetical protein